MWKKKKNIRKMAFNTETVLMAAKAPLNTVLTYFQTTSLGLTDEEVEKRLSLYGKNEIVHEQKKKPLVMLAKAFINPFVGVLTVLVAISYVMDVWMADSGDQDWTSIIVVSTMIILSTILRFVQEWKANRSSEALQKMVTNTCYVMRLGTSTRGGSPSDEISNEELVPGDLIMLCRRHDSCRCPHHRIQGFVRQPIQFDRRIRFHRKIPESFGSPQPYGQHR